MREFYGTQQNRSDGRKVISSSEQNYQITQNEFLVFQAEPSVCARNAFLPIRLTSECFNLPFLYYSVGNSRDDVER